MVILLEAAISGSSPANTNATVLVAKAPPASQVKRLCTGGLLSSKVIELLNLQPEYVNQHSRRLLTARWRQGIMAGNGDRAMSLPHPAVDQIELAQVLAVLGDPTRLGIVVYL